MEPFRGAPLTFSRVVVQLLTVSQVAEQVGLSGWAVRRAIHDGELAACKLRGQLRVDAADLQAWVDGARVTPVRRASVEMPRALTPSPAYPEAGSFRARTRKKEKP